MSQHNTTPAPSADWINAHGPVPVRMTNDYLFRALMQRSERTLKVLTCALLHLDPDHITVDLRNPIVLGETIKDKDFILDLLLLLNNGAIINTEMQVINEGNWPERSLCYLCRAFNNLNTGENYSNVHPAVHIGLLDFTLFADSPEFYASYYFMNVKNHRIYSDKLRLSVLDLTQINLATEEDCHYKLNEWAAFFKATTWEEIKMLAKNNPDIADAADTVFQLTQEQVIRMQIDAREDYYRRTVGREEMLLKSKAENRHLKTANAQLLSEVEQLASENARVVADRDQAIADKDRAVADKDQAIADKDRAVAEAEFYKKLLEENGISVPESNE